MHSRNIYNCQIGCPVESTLQFIAGKWKSVILYHLLTEPVCHFGTLAKAIPGCSRRMLAIQLNKLIRDGLITKQVVTIMPPKTNYTLTDFGKTLRPVILAMVVWGNYYNQRPESARL